MDYEIYFEREQKVVLVAFQHDLTEHSYTTAVAEVTAFGKSETLEAGILDLSGIRSFQLSSEFLASLAQTPQILQKPRVVVAPDDVAFGMARMFEMLRGKQEKSRFVVVRTLEQAFETLRLVGTPRFERIGP